MATVYLPMGYPIQQGTEFDLIVYQGNLVRLYTLPADPRNDSQLFQRKFLSDVAKMRGFLGETGRAALTAALGTTWATVLFQLIKNDAFSWWSDAETVWEAMNETDKQDWRDAAPYQVTYNDKGWIFFGLCRVMASAIAEYSVGAWLTKVWQAGEAGDALAWFEADRDDAFQTGSTFYNSGVIRFYGSWATMTWHYGVSSGQQWRSSGSENDYAELVFFSKRLLLFAYVDSSLGTGDVFVDGVNVGSLNLNGTFEYKVFSMDFTKKKVRSIVFKGRDGEMIAVREGRITV